MTVLRWQNYYWFLMFRTMVGIGEASYSTIAPTIISDMFVQDMRSKMLALFYFAIPVGRWDTSSSLSISSRLWRSLELANRTLSRSAGVLDAAFDFTWRAVLKVTLLPTPNNFSRIKVFRIAFCIEYLFRKDNSTARAIVWTDCDQLMMFHLLKGKRI